MRCEIFVHIHAHDLIALFSSSRNAITFKLHTGIKICFTVSPRYEFSKLEPYEHVLTNFFSEQSATDINFSAMRTNSLLGLPSMMLVGIILS